MAIRILDASTVGRIAAGEVVERPASAIKELFENALDAGASAVTVEIRGGGIDSLRVTDNGCGIPPSEVRLAFENHATSKLKSAEQLQDIRTLGFRGEALPSIAAVARVTCTTRQKGAPSGVRLVIEGGEVKALEEAGCPEGTTVVVEDLFFNTPVRRTFLKKPAYEAGVVVETVGKLLLANPGISVKLINGGKTVLSGFGDGNLRHAALAVYGREVAAMLTRIDQAEGALSISGLIGVGDCARPTRSQQSLFINGRVVRCPLVQQALETACRGRVTIGMHPMCMLSLRLPSSSVDVNVHPNKLEVRFRDEVGVRTTLDTLFARAFEGERLLDLEKAARPSIEAAPVVSVQRINPTEIKKQTKVTDMAPIEQKQTSVFSEGIDSLAPPIPRSERPVLREKRAAMPPLQVSYPPEATGPAGNRRIAPDASIPPAPRPPLESSAPVQAEAPVIPEFRVIGVAFNTYVLVESGGALIMIDQHAAHERILYEKYAPLLAAGRASQQLLTPVILPVSKKELSQIEEQKALLESAGFSVEPFGEGSVALRAVPFVLGQADLRPLFMEMLDRLDQLKYATEEKRRLELIQTACKHAVKGGDPLSQEEIAQLIQAMLKTRSPATCPHGRPVARSFTRAELERMFKRQQ